MRCNQSELAVVNFDIVWPEPRGYQLSLTSSKNDKLKYISDITDQVLAQVFNDRW